MKEIFFLLIILVIVPTKFVAASPFFSQRVENPNSRDSAAGSDVDAFFGRGSIFADNVTLESSKTARSVIWWGYFDDNKVPSSLNFNIKFYANKNGLPDTENILSSTNIAFIKFNDTGENFGGESRGEDIYVFYANLTPTNITKQEQVWLSIQADSGNTSDGVFMWRFDDGISGAANQLSDPIRFPDKKFYKFFIEPNRDFSFVLDDEFINNLPIPDKDISLNEIESFSNTKNPFSLTFKTSKDSSYKVEASSNLKKWTTLSQIQGTGNPITFTEKREILFRKQYYRVTLSD